MRSKDKAVLRSDCLVVKASRMTTTPAELHVAEIPSYVRGYRAYIMEHWTPVAGQELLLKQVPTNDHDAYAVAVYYDGQVVGHVPNNLAAILSAFLRKEVNKGFAEVTVDRVNRGAGYKSHAPTVCLGPKCTLTS